MSLLRDVAPLLLCRLQDGSVGGLPSWCGMSVAAVAALTTSWEGALIRLDFRHVSTAVIGFDDGRW